MTLHVKRPLWHRQHDKLRRAVAQRFGVSEERLLWVVEQRKKFRRARYFRDWKRKKKGVGKSSVYLGNAPDTPYAGEGELITMLRVIGMNPQEFCELMGMSYKTFRLWYGTSLHLWPLELMRYYGWSMKMAAKLKELGVDAEALKPQLPVYRRKNQYPVGKTKLELVMPGEYSPWKKEA